MKSTVFTWIVCLLVIGVLFTSPKLLEAQNREGGNIGIGVIIGEPTGLTVKTWTSERSAFAAAAAWTLSGRNVLHLHLDYQMHNYDMITAQRGILSTYWGIGGRLLLREGRDDVVGARIPLGLNYFFQDTPLETFIEIVPKVNLIPDVDIDVGAGAGVRFYF